MEASRKKRLWLKRLKLTQLRQESDKLIQDLTCAKLFLADIWGHFVKKKTCCLLLLFLYIRHPYHYKVFSEVSFHFVAHCAWKAARILKALHGQSLYILSAQSRFPTRKKQILNSGFLLCVGFMFVYPKWDGTEVKATFRLNKELKLEGGVNTC